MIIQEVLTHLGEFAILVGAIAWLAKKIITQQLSKDMEIFKSQLQKESQREIESLKSHLALTAYEHQVLFSRMHQKRADVVEETYADLVELQRAASDFVRLYQSSDDAKNREHIHSLWEAAGKFVNHFEKHRIYFNADVCGKIAGMNQKLSEATSILVTFSVGSKTIHVSFEEALDQWEKAMDVLEKEVPPIKTALEDTFRELLGVVEPIRSN